MDKRVVSTTTSLAVVAVITMSLLPASARTERSQSSERLPRTGNVIFMHPDGSGVNHWLAARMYWYGPDASMNYDKLPAMAVYRGHMMDELTGTSNGGATTHAFGYKVEARGSYGRDGDGDAARPIKGLSGFNGSIMREAAAKGHPIGIVNDGNIGEPGTGAFLAEVPNRNDWDAIALQIWDGRPGSKDQRPHVIMGGGERQFLPPGVQGVHGEGENKLLGSRNLISEALESDYVVLRTREEFEELRAQLAVSPTYAPKVLGLFAHHHIFNDRPEEVLIATGYYTGTLPLTNTKESELVLYGTPVITPAGFNPPTVAEMTEVAILILDRVSKKVGKPFFLVAETESVDNFGNNDNAIGTLTALKHADDAIGVALDYLGSEPDTLLLLAADSDAGGMQVRALQGPLTQTVTTVNFNPTGADADKIDAKIDGLYGRDSFAFVSEPDQFGKRWPFAITWTGTPDVAGGILVRAAGLNSDLITTAFSERFDNVDIYRMMYLTLFGRLLPYPQGKLAPNR
jgi:alkaline phosphatase